MSSFLSAAEVVNRDLDRVDLEIRRAPPVARALRVAVLVGILAAVGAVIVDPGGRSPEDEAEILALLDAMPAEGLPFEALEARERELLLDLARETAPSNPVVLPLLAGTGAFALVTLPLIGLFWWWAGPIRLSLTRHWIELDGDRVELADLSGLEIRDGCVRIELPGTAPRLSDPLLRPTEVGYFLEAADELIRPAAREAEATGRARTRAALEPLLQRT